MGWVLSREDRVLRLLLSFLVQFTEWIVESFMETVNSGERVSFKE